MVHKILKLAAVFLLAHGFLLTLGCSRDVNESPEASGSKRVDADLKSPESIPNTAPSEDPAMSKYNALVPVRAKYAAIFKPGVSKDYGKHANVMRELLAEWNPVGLSEDQIVFVLGPPTSQDKEYNVFGYHFENGFNGVGWDFVFKQGVVERVEKHGIQ